jgi:hypothetical protein
MQLGRWLDSYCACQPAKAWRRQDDWRRRRGVGWRGDASRPHTTRRPICLGIGRLETLALFKLSNCVRSDPYELFTESESRKFAVSNEIADVALGATPEGRNVAGAEGMALAHAAILMSGAGLAGLT